MEFVLTSSFLAGVSSPGFILGLLINAFALFIAAHFLEGVEIKSFGSALIIAIVLAFLNATIGTFLSGITGCGQSQG